MSGRGGSEQRTQLSGEPEWQLVLETDEFRKELWKMRSGDISLLLSLTAFDSIEQLPETTSQNSAVTETKSHTAAPPQQTVIGAPTSQSLQSAVLRRLNLNESPRQSDAPVQPTGGIVLSGNLQEVDFSSILQSVNICKMTGKLMLSEPTQLIELYFAEGELAHARVVNALNDVEQASGEEALLTAFTWSAGSFKFQPGWQTSQRTVQRKLYALLLEGAALQDYKAALSAKNITPSSVLMVAQDIANVSESEFDEILKKGIPTHYEVQKKIFLELKTPKSLALVIEHLKLSSTMWVPAVFNLVNLKVLNALVTTTQDTTDSANNTVYELISAAHKALLQPESGMFGYPLFLIMLRNELARCSDGGSPFCLALLEFNQAGYDPDRTALSHISSSFDSIRRTYDVIAFAPPKHCYILLPQTDREKAHTLIRRFGVLMGTKPELGLIMKAGLAAVPKEGNELVTILNKLTSYCNNSNEREPIVTASSTLIIG